MYLEKFWKLKIKHYLRTHIHTNHEKTTQMIVDQDTQWKEIITDLWEDFVEFFLPQAYPFVDFSKKPVFLEQELHKLIRDKEKKGKRINDKLVKVFLKDGSNHRFLLHIEVQSSEKTEFLKRMFTYFYRIFDKHKEKFTAIAIYTGKKTPKQYDRFTYDFFGTKVTYIFNTYRVEKVKKKDLLHSKNPFALAVLAAQYLNATENDAEKRLHFKMKIFRLAVERNYSKEKTVSLIQFINFLLVLSEDYELKFNNEIKKLLKVDDMNKVKSYQYNSRPQKNNHSLMYPRYRQ